MQGCFIISRPWEKLECLRIFASLSFPFPHFNLKTLNVTDHLQVTWLIFDSMNMSHIVKATELKLLAKFHDDWSKQSVSNATSPNYANYEESHALTCPSRKCLVVELDKNKRSGYWRLVFLRFYVAARNHKTNYRLWIRFGSRINGVPLHLGARKENEFTSSFRA